MKNAKVSVVMPVLNGMPYFKAALESQLRQTLSDIEIIVVDAGSSDGTREYVTTCSETDRRVRLVDSEKKSMGAQYNLGITISNGEYVGFCESDDYVEPDMMEKLYAVAKKNDEPDCVKSDFYMFIGKTGEEFSLRYGVLPRHRQDLYGIIFRLDDEPGLFFRDVNMWNGIFRKHFLVENGITLNETSGAAFQDTDFVHQANMLAERQIFVPYPFYHYRRDNESSSMYKKETARFAMQECMYMMQWFKSHEKEKDAYAEYSIERIAGFFASIYGKNIYYLEKLSFEDEVEEFRKALCDFCGGLKFSQQTHLLRNSVIAQFMRSPSIFRQTAVDNYRAQLFYLYRVREMLQTRRCAVIMSAGELGQSVCAFLNRNRYDGEICFCDNDKRMQGAKVLDCQVYAVEDAACFFPDAAYFINPKYERSLESQLISCGITRDQIVHPYYIAPHTSMELDWSAQ